MFVEGYAYSSDMSRRAIIYLSFVIEASKHRIPYKYICSQILDLSLYTDTILNLIKLSEESWFFWLPLHIRPG